MLSTAHTQKKKLSSEEFRIRLKLKHLEVKTKLFEAHPHVIQFFQKRGIELGRIREHSTKLLSAGMLTGSLLLTNPSGELKLLPSPSEVLGQLKFSPDLKDKSSATVIVETIKSVLPKNPRPLTRSEEKFLEQIFLNMTKIPARASLEGEHLNTTYGYIGAEQHLRRFPGDSLGDHGNSEIQRSGMAPGLGAWGYFAKSRNELNANLIEKEKWYAVVQTLYLPDWNRRVKYLREWYKYRKVLVVNADNGKSVVTAIADSGPAAWTGKHFGGSPEVMNYLGGPRYKKGPVIIFFVDDPENKIPLGPVTYE